MKVNRITRTEVIYLIIFWSSCRFTFFKRAKNIVLLSHVEHVCLLANFDQAWINSFHTDDTV